MCEKYYLFKYNDELVNKYNNKNEIFNEYTYKYQKFSHYSYLIKRIVLFSVITKGKYSVFCVYSPEKKLIHYSFIIPKCSKFTFMEKDDYQIGPCWTSEEYRGKGVYGNVLNFICCELKKNNENSNIYVLIRKSNSSSIKGIEKANFEIVGYCKKNKFKKYSLER